MNDRSERDPDVALARAQIDRRLLSREDLRRCLAERDARRSRGESATLIEVVREGGLVEPAAFERLLVRARPRPRATPRWALVAAGLVALAAAVGIAAVAARSSGVGGAPVAPESPALAGSTADPEVVPLDEPRASIARATGLLSGPEADRRAAQDELARARGSLERAVLEAPARAEAHALLGEAWSLSVDLARPRPRSGGRWRSTPPFRAGGPPRPGAPPAGLPPGDLARAAGGRRRRRRRLRGVGAGRTGPGRPGADPAGGRSPSCSTSSD